MSPLSVLVVASALVASAKGASLGDSPSPVYGLAPLGLGKVRRHGRGRGRGHNIDPQIVGGWDAQPGEFPHQVSMQVVLPGFLWFEADPQHICGGSLIATDWVLTAAHCVHGVPVSTIRTEAVVGITDLTQSPPGSQRILVSRMVQHPKYEPYTNSGVGPWDIGLLKLATDAVLNSIVKLAVLPVANLIPTGTATLSGWGSTSSNGDRPIYPNKLQTADFPIVDFNSCYSWVSKTSPGSKNPLNSESNLCVGPLDRTGLSSCSGDSGGPLIQTESNEAVVIGVVSWGLTDCGSVPFPSVFTRVSSFRDWIATETQK